MTEISKLSLAYQLQAAGDVRPLAEIVAQIEADATALAPPPPGPGDVIGSRRVVRGDEVLEHVEILGDGTERPVA